MAIRWINVWVGLVVVAGAALLATPIAVAAVLLGPVRGTLVIAAGSILLTATVLQIVPTVGSSTPLGRLIARFRGWVIDRAQSPNLVVRWASRAGGGVGLVVASIVLGPTVTTVMVAIARGERTNLWGVTVITSLIFSAFAVNLFAGVWAWLTR
jgi:hypothetical protein